MSYEQPFQVDLSFAAVPATTAVARYIRIPWKYGGTPGAGSPTLANQAGTSIRFARIVECLIDVTTTVVGTTTTSRIQYGTAASAGKYAIMKVGVDTTGIVAPGAWGFLDYDPFAAVSAGLYRNRIDLFSDGDAAGTFQGFLNINTVSAVGTPAGIFDFTTSIQFF